MDSVLQYLYPTYDKKSTRKREINTFTQRR